MSRVAQSSKSKFLMLVIPLVIGLAAIVGATTTNNGPPPATVVTAQSQTTDVKYMGVNGRNALDLLKQYATVQTKHYSFGDQVISINGTTGNGPKYWSFYVNGKLASVGAGAYDTKSTDQIEWKLQSL